MSAQNLDMPVLIYLAKDPCPGCSFYNKEWEKVKKELDGKARFVKFTCKPGTPGGNIPPVFNQYFQPNGWFPTVLLAGPKSYFRAFTPEDKVNEDEYSDSYTVRAKPFNRIEIASGYDYAGRPNTAENTILWFNQVVGTVPQYDESIPPRKFAHLFSNNVDGQGYSGTISGNGNLNVGQMDQVLKNSNGNSLKFYI